MSQSTRMVLVIGATALAAWVIVAGVHDAAIILFGPIAPSFAFMSP